MHLYAKRIFYTALVFLGLTFLPQPGHSLDLSDIRTQVRRYMLDADSSNNRYTNAEILTYINEVQRDFINQTWAIRTSVEITLVANTTYYDLPNDLIAITQVIFTNSSNNTIELEEKPERYFYTNEPDFERQSASQPDRYFVRLSTFGANPLEIAFIPVPNSTADDGTLRVDYLNIATDLSSDSDIPFDGFRHLFPYHDSLIYGTVARLKFIEGMEDAVAFNTVYQNLVKIAIDRLGRAPNWNPSLLSP